MMRFPNAFLRAAAPCLLAFALIGFVCALGLDWKAFSRNAMIALTIALFGLGLALVFSAAWQPRGQFPEVAQTAP